MGRSLLLLGLALQSILFPCLAKARMNLSLSVCLQAPKITALWFSIWLSTLITKAKLT